MKVSPIMLLKIHIEKMSENSHATMYMKINNVEVARHYIDEKTGSYRKSEFHGRENVEDVR